jgi:RimJ/RimL family protein N-acetyltransferase
MSALVEPMSVETIRCESGADFELRRLSPADREALIAMYESFEPKRACLGLPPAKAPERWLDGLAQFPNFIVLDGARIAAHAVLCAEGRSAEIAVFVQQDYRGRGFGKRLLCALIETARAMGLRRVWGVTDLDNVPMLRLARSLGFVSGTDPREFCLELESAATLAPKIAPAA